MTKTVELNFHYDTGHGWLQVHKNLIVDLGMIFTNFSGCSYIKDDFLYLEEDCDAPKLMIEARKQCYTVNIIQVDDGDRSIIRSYRNL